ncbi:MAG TPA: PspC domain-containing protein [Bacteroidia bacterium]|nr:PspC domain-containing protein [Bacteroidia bacterium]HNT80118.1 PspC domain-containing protein [Bacteroidia bacterium]
MNKTVTVNIGGLVFHIEEQAYEKLRKYLDTIKSYFSVSQGRDEIIQDIESRIAEMFQQRLSAAREVVTSEDVEFVISSMGRPEEVAGDEAVPQGEQLNNEYDSTTGTKSYRRLFRDEDDAVIGGVCSGISHRLDIDPVWMRLAFALALIFFGSGILIYIILWIIMPKAKNQAEKLEMRGMPVTIENLKKSFGTSMGESNFVELEKDARAFFENKDRKEKNFIQRFFGFLGDFLKLIIKAILAFITFIFGVVLFAFLIAIIILTLGMMGVSGISIPVFISEYFIPSSQQVLFIVGVLLFLGLPLLFLLTKILSSVFGRKELPKLFSRTTWMGMVVGIVLLIIFGVNMAKEFKSDYYDRTSVIMPQPDSVLLLEFDKSNYNDKKDGSFQFFGFDDGDFSYEVGEDAMQAAFSDVELDIVKSNSDQFEMIQTYSSKGKSRKDAGSNLESITYQFQQSDSSLTFSDFFTLPKGQFYRGQKVRFLLKVPVGKSVYLAPGMEHIIYDIDNVTGTYDDDMIGLTWTMTKRGLECLNCDLPERSIYGRRSDKYQIDIKSNEGSLTINDSIKVDMDDVKIKVDDEGIRIRTK